MPGNSRERSTLVQNHSWCSQMVVDKPTQVDTCAANPRVQHAVAELLNVNRFDQLVLSQSRSVAKRRWTKSLIESGAHFQDWICLRQIANVNCATSRNRLLP